MPAGSFEGGGPSTRRAFLRRAGRVGAGLAGAWLVACRGGTDGGTARSAPTVTRIEATAPAAIKPGGAMKVVWETEPQGTMDPHKTAGGGSRPMQGAIFEGFLYKPPAKPAEGMLAEAWEIPDPTTFIFRLRSGVRFQDGTDLTAEVAQWNMERTRQPGFLFESGYRGAAAGLSRIEATDATTVKVRFDRAKVDSLAAFYFVGQNSLTGMASREAVTRLGDRFDRQPVGTGPFVLKEWISDTRMVYEKFAGYWQKDAQGRQLPYLDGLTFSGIPNENVAVIALQNNEIQATPVGPLPAAQLEADRNIDLYRRQVPTQTIYFNHQKPPFDNVHLRRAVAYAIKRDELCKVAFLNQARPNGGGYTKDGDWHDPNFKGQTYDPQIVRQSLQAGGAPNGFSFELAVVPTGPRKTAGELIQTHLKEFGINASLVLMETNEFVARGLNRGELQAMQAAAGTTGLDDTPSGLTSFLQGPWRIIPPPDVAKPGLDIFTKMQTAFDVKERYALHQELAQWFWVDMVIRAELFDEMKIFAQRKEFGGFDFWGTAPQGNWNRAYRRA
jgi:ABC-type transport system substrate-binding protein